MPHPAPEPPQSGKRFHELPLDPDLDAGEDQQHHRGPSARDRTGATRRSRWPPIHWRSVAAVGLGGLLGGLARYGIGLLWPTPVGAFPSATLVINTSGAFLLALLLVVVLEVLPPTTYLRPTLGTGFLGAYTTFSSVAVAGDQLTTHGHTTIAAMYLAGSVVAGVLAACLGLVLGRFIAGSRAPEREPV